MYRHRFWVVGPPAGRFSWRRQRGRYACARRSWVHKVVYEPPTAGEIAKAITVGKSNLGWSSFPVSTRRRRDFAAIGAGGRVVGGELAAVGGNVAAKLAEQEAVAN